MNDTQHPYGAWIDPKGNIYDVFGWGMHEESAIKITGGVMPQNDESAIPESMYLLASGWGRIVFENKNCISFQVNIATKYQIDYISIFELVINESAQGWNDFLDYSNKIYFFHPFKKFKTNVTIDSQANS